MFDNPPITALLSYPLLASSLKNFRNFLIDFFIVNYFTIATKPNPLGPTWVPMLVVTLTKSARPGSES